MDGSANARSSTAGDRHMQPCPVAKIYPRGNADDSHRWYIEFATPSCGTVHRTRIDTTDADRSCGYNRAEHLRQHVKTDDRGSVYDRCYGWRRRQRKPQQHPRPHPLWRADDRFAAVRQLTVMLGFALGRNAIAAYLHRRRHPEERTA